MSAMCFWTEVDSPPCMSISAAKAASLPPSTCMAYSLVVLSPPSPPLPLASIIHFVGIANCPVIKHFFDALDGSFVLQNLFAHELMVFPIVLVQVFGVGSTQGLQVVEIFDECLRRSLIHQSLPFPPLSQTATRTTTAPVLLPQVLPPSPLQTSSVHRAPSNP